MLFDIDIYTGSVLHLLQNLKDDLFVAELYLIDIICILSMQLYISHSIHRTSYSLYILNMYHLYFFIRLI